jgi:peptidoglycan/xylan/chitin deacetylase (PgdA/CDA1 family)
VDPRVPDRIAARRRETERRRARRRLLVAAAGLATIAAVVAVALANSGSDGPAAEDGGSTTAADASEPPVGRGAETKLVANATPGPDWSPHIGPVPILEYHVLGAAPADAPYPELYVTRPDFRRQLDWLEKQRYEAVTLDQVQKAFYDGGMLPPKPVVLTFDDGYRPQFTSALPELRKHGWAGVLNLKAKGSDLYTSNVEAMISAGWELASHTINHLDLTTLDASALEHELQGSRAILRRDYHVPVDNFCYPAGRYDATVIAAVKAAGYAGATTEIPGYAARERPYELNRFEILGSSGVKGLASDLASG